MMRAERQRFGTERTGSSEARRKEEPEPAPRAPPIPEEALQFMKLPLTERERKMRVDALWRARPPH